MKEFENMSQNKITIWDLPDFSMLPALSGTGKTEKKFGFYVQAQQRNITAFKGCM